MKHRFQGFRKLLFGSGANFPPEEAVQTPFQTVLQNFFRNPPAVIGLVVIVTIFACCFILPVFFPLDPNYQDATQQNVPPGLGMLRLPEEMKARTGTVAVGSVFSAGIDTEGHVYVWGQASEQLRKIPEGLNKAADISAGQDHILAVGSDGKLYTWGNSRFSLGSIPPELTGEEIWQIVAGNQVSLALTTSGELFFWGNENLLSLRLGEEVQGRIRKVALSSAYCLALLENGKAASLTSRETAVSAIPASIQGQVTDLAVTEKAAAAVTADGRITVWGSRDGDAFDVPEELQGKAVSIMAGRSHFSALSSDGKVFCWGSNSFGQLDVPASLKGERVTALYTGSYQNYAVTASGKTVSWGLRGYLMGTDGYGRDIFLRLISGGRLTLTIGAIAVAISTVLGVLVGGFSGYYGGRTDMLLMRFAEIVGSIPFLPLAMILSAVIGNRVSEMGRISMIMVILGVLSWPGLSRLVRAQILAEREKEFVTAARAAGVRERAILFRHILPNVVTVIIVSATLDFAACLLTESSLSFLGFGVVEPSPTWGNMLTGSQSSAVIGSYWWRWVFPALALSLATISINLVGDGLRDAIDPKSSER